MNKLTVAKALDDLKRIKKDFSKDPLGDYLNLYILKLVDFIQSGTGIKLTRKSTTPKILFGKKYKDLTQEELREYTQIKRIVKRNSK